MQVRQVPASGFRVGLLQIIHVAGFDGDDARAATARAAAGINFDSLRAREFQNIFRRRFPANGFIRARERDV